MRHVAHIGGKHLDAGRRVALLGEAILEFLHEVGHDAMELIIAENKLACEGLHCGGHDEGFLIATVRGVVIFKNCCFLIKIMVGDGFETEVKSCAMMVRCDAMKRRNDTEESR